ncbi:MAG: hypothetical protein J0I20_11855 [Chloroflexi bacterium]|nr:hypothetical protein [Chloroflexota bacterium]OJV92425.1 MAG: hypothetical protein BGO39_31370 [Chloroflexi bacterium 54-19]
MHKNQRNAPGVPEIMRPRPTGLSSRYRSRNFKLARLMALVVLVLTLVITVFGNAGLQSGTGSTQGGYGQAAAATPPPVSNQLPLNLPQSKEEAQAFEAQHRSPYNFDTLTQMRLQRAVALGELPASVLDQPQKAPVATPAAPLNSPFSTPTPTNSAYSNGNSSLFVFNPTATPNVSACGSDPGDDIFEQDNTVSSARDVTGSVAPSLKETHTLRTVSSFPAKDPAFDGDQDWIKIHLIANTTYTFATDNLKPDYPVTVDTVIELYRGPATGTPTSVNDLTPINANDDISSSDFASSLTYTASAADAANGVYFYLRVYGKPNVSCFGTYDLIVTYSTVPTVTPTATVTPVASTCADAYESDDAPASAKELRVTYGTTPPFNGQPGTPDFTSTNNNVQAHFICPQADQDWVYFDLVKGKPYSIFTANLLNGLDTMLVLFQGDANGVLTPIYSSDDFPGMGLASRIDFIVPATSTTATGEYTRYYAVVKDVTGKGTDNLAYQLVLESAGNAQGDCIDNYEPDGLQSDAKDILVNEVQTHVMCPAGDADWVKFFAKAGRTYTMKTAFPPTPGLDTDLHVFSVLFDPADATKVVSQRELASNDDASATDLSSSVNFSVPVDGIYYAQVKNNGDVGRNGLTYTISYLVAGGTAVPPTTAPGETATPTTSTATTTPNLTATANAAATITASAAGPSLLSLQFADPAFQKLWYYTDLAVAQNQTQRSWEWGPKPGVVLQEKYAESPGGSRQVQYFDKSRMEINNPKGDRSSAWFVSNGLLVRELITGKIATGDSAFEQRSPARIQVAGDITPDNPAPTYAQFAGLITDGDANRAADLTGQTVQQGLAADGTVTTLSAAPENLKLSLYVKETGHNIPQVFADYMQENGKVYDNGYKDGQLRDWVFAMGYPISEPYWIKATVGGVQKDVLVQLFERRVLTYTPSNTPEWRVEMANVGQHYYFWRYGRSLLSD